AAVRIAGPASTDGDIQDDEKRVLIHPLRSFRKIGRSTGRVQVIVDVEADRFLLPFDGIHVKVGREPFVAGQSVSGTRSLSTRISRTVNRAVDRRWFLPYIFHDVDLTALRPSNFPDVVAEQPECRPDPLSLGNLDARLEASILLRELAFGLQPRRSVIARDAIGSCVLFLDGLNDQIPVLLE